MIVIIFIEYFIVRVVISIGKKSKNQLIIAQGLNFKGDIYRNISVIVGLFVAGFGFFMVDLIIAGVYSLFAIKSGLAVLRESFLEMIDTNSISDELLDEIRVSVLKLHGVKKIEEFAIKTAGNNLDASISILVKEDISSSETKVISDQIRLIIRSICKGYKANIFVQSNLDSSVNSENLFADIRLIIKEVGFEYDIHNIMLNQYQDTLLVQFHMKFDPNMPLGETHRIGKEFSEKIKKEVLPHPGFAKISIINHLEPQDRPDGWQCSPQKKYTEEEIKTIIVDLVEFFEGIESVGNLQIMEEGEKFSLLLVVNIKADICIREAHFLAERLKNRLHFTFENMEHCMVHTHPI